MKDGSALTMGILQEKHSKIKYNSRGGAFKKTVCIYMYIILLIVVVTLFIAVTSLFYLKAPSTDKPIMEPPMITIPKGPATQTYLEHSKTDIENHMLSIIDTDKGINRFKDIYLGDLTEFNEESLEYIRNWLLWIRSYRTWLDNVGLSNYVKGKDAATAVYRNIDSIDDVIESEDEESGVKDETDNSGTAKVEVLRTNDDAFSQSDLDISSIHISDALSEVFVSDKEKAMRYRWCLENEDDCGSLSSVPIVNSLFSLVLSVNLEFQNRTWTALESVRQLAVYPKEVVLVLMNSESWVNTAEQYAFFTLINDIYLNDLPPSVVFKVYTAEKHFHFGNCRQFGISLTTTPYVTFLNSAHNGVYLHPQYYQALQTVVRQRPELDYGLLSFNAVQGNNCNNVRNMNKQITDFLEKYKFTEENLESYTTWNTDEYKAVRDSLPAWSSEWYLGNSAAEPMWSGNQVWFDYGCSNTWSMAKRSVLNNLPYPTDIGGVEDAIYNFRVLMAKFNYKCLHIVLATEIGTNCFINYFQHLK